MTSISAFRNATSRARTVPKAVVSARTFAGDWLREPGARDPASRTVSGSSVLAGQPPMPRFGTPQGRPGHAPGHGGPRHVPASAATGSSAATSTRLSGPDDLPDVLDRIHRQPGAH
jgi:hypothetical protein